ncbi:CREB-regulated transcription coactivator 1-like [Schistocerca nitens]|uniref:CREB-regulated transcription coactivator 1-like n=1 Tax=Schistocerca nitens TaxID=7011 RepID=UPI0021194D5B|nr:CREB-regulated transcription coactivator 1-like [Schistocerca nitens]
MDLHIFTLLALVEAFVLEPGMQRPGSPRPPPTPPPRPRPPKPPPRPQPPPPTPPAAAAAPVVNLHPTRRIDLGMFEKESCPEKDIAERQLIEDHKVVAPVIATFLFPVDGGSMIIVDLEKKLQNLLTFPSAASTVATESRHHSILSSSFAYHAMGSMCRRPVVHGSDDQRTDFNYLEGTAAQQDCPDVSVKTPYTLKLSSSAPEGPGGFVDQNSAPLSTVTLPKGDEQQLSGRLPKKRWENSYSDSTGAPAVLEVYSYMPSQTSETCASPSAALDSYSNTQPGATSADKPAVGAGLQQEQLWQHPAQLPTAVIPVPEYKALLWSLCIFACLLPTSPGYVGHNTNPQPAAGTLLLLQNEKAGNPTAFAGPAREAVLACSWDPEKPFNQDGQH